MRICDANSARLYEQRTAEGAKPSAVPLFPGLSLFVGEQLRFRAALAIAAQEDEPLVGDGADAPFLPGTLDLRTEIDVFILQELHPLPAGEGIGQVHEEARQLGKGRRLRQPAGFQEAVDLLQKLPLERGVCLLPPGSDVFRRRAPSPEGAAAGLFAARALILKAAVIAVRPADRTHYLHRLILFVFFYYA